MDNLCRLCGQEKTNLTSIFEMENLVENIHRYLQIQIFEEDALSHKTCSTCIDDVQRMVQFITDSHKTQRKLLKLLKTKIPQEEIKVEDSSVDIETKMEVDDSRSEKLPPDLSEAGDPLSELPEDNVFPLKVPMVIIPVLNLERCASLIRQYKKQNTNTSTKCSQCSYVAPHKYQLTQHKREVHVKPLICAECGKRLSKKSRLLIHIKNKHMTKTSYQCEICTTKYTSKKWFEVHQKKGCPGALPVQEESPFE